MLVEQEDLGAIEDAGRLIYISRSRYSKFAERHPCSEPSPLVRCSHGQILPTSGPLSRKDPRRKVECGRWPNRVI